MSPRSRWSRLIAAVLVAGQAALPPRCRAPPTRRPRPRRRPLPGMVGVRAYADASAAEFVTMAASPERKRRPSATSPSRAAAATAPTARGCSTAGRHRARGRNFTIVSGVSTGRADRPVRLPRTGLRSLSHRHLHQRHRRFAGAEPEPRQRAVRFGPVRRRTPARPDRPLRDAGPPARGGGGACQGAAPARGDDESRFAARRHLEHGRHRGEGAPNAVSLFTDVLTASASIPAVFPPQLLDVQAEGALPGDACGRLGGDAGLHPPAIVPRARRAHQERGKADIFVVINGRLEPEFDVTRNNTLSIVEKSFTTASRARSRATLVATDAFASRNWHRLQPDLYRRARAPGQHGPRLRHRLHAQPLPVRLRDRPHRRFWHRDVPAAPLVKDVVQEAVAGAEGRGNRVRAPSSAARG